VVDVDTRERVLTVRPAKSASNYVKLLWREAVRELSKEEYAWSAPSVWAAGDGKSNIALGHPTADNALAFRFKTGDPTYQNLVTKPGLRAFITVDRAGGIRGVTFRGRDR
jgi:hypothetical protein